VSPILPLLDLLKLFQTGRSHLALVSWQADEYNASFISGFPIESSCRLLGCVTMEDVVETLLREDVCDESDLMVASSLRRTDSAQRDLRRIARSTFGVQKAKHRFLGLLKSRLRPAPVQHEKPLQIIAEVHEHDVDLPYQLLSTPISSVWLFPPSPDQACLGLEQESDSI
jgi:hypothetical protein